MTVQFRMLGSLEVLRDGVAVHPTSAKQRAVLAVLLVHANRVVPVDTLADAVWQGRPPPTATGVLQTYVSHLRKAIEPAISGGKGPQMLVTADPGYRLEVRPEDVDVSCFERLLADGRAALRDGRPEVATEVLREALALWRGPALAGVADEEPLRSEALRLEALRILGIEERVEADIALGRHGELVGELTQLVGSHPLRERLWAQLMLCRYRVGLQADALRAFQDLRHGLAEDLGLEPGPELLRLEHDILAQDPSLDWHPPSPVDHPGGPPTPASGSNLPSWATGSPFVGRTDELAQLRTWWRDEGEAAPVALVVGEAGVGKTRLVTVFAREIEAGGSAVCFGRALEEGGSAYEPVLGALRHYVLTAADDVIDALGETAAGALSRLVPEMGERRPEVAPRAVAWGDVDRSWLLSAAADGLAGHGRADMLLVLDDMQWADRPALLLLSRLVEPDKGIRILGTCRVPGSAPTTHLADFLSQMRRDERPVRRVSVGGLKPEEVVELVVALSDGPLRPGEEALVSALHRRTNGNPLFVRETLRELENTGAMPVDGLDELPHLPEGVKDAVSCRLTHLPPATGDALRAAAVIGVEFDLDVLAAVLGGEDQQVLDAVEEALVAGLVQEDPHRVDRYAFVHGVVHEVLLDQLSRSRRARVEWRAGEALERLRGGELDERAGELARHFAAGAVVGDAARVLRWSLRAGAHATMRLAYEEAISLYETALEAVTSAGGPPPVERVDVLVALGRAADLAGNKERWQTACFEAVGLARGAGDHERLARAAIALLGPLGPGPTDASVVALMEEAADTLAEAPASPARQALLAEVLGRLSGYLNNSHPDRSAELAEKALEIARGAGDRRSVALALIYSTQGYALDHDEHQARLHEAVPLAEEAGDLEWVLAANTNLMAGSLLWADRDEFDRHLAEYARVATLTSAPVPLLLSDIDHAGAAALDGRYVEASDRLRDARRRAEPLGDRNIRLSIGAGTVPVDRELGRLAHHVDPLRRAVTTMSDIPSYRAALVRALCEAGAFDEANHLLDAVLVDPQAFLSGQLRRFNLAQLAEAAELLGDAQAAAQLLPWMEDELRNGECVIMGPNAYFGAVRRYLGLLALTVGNAGQAVSHHEAALALHEQMRSPGWAARSRYDLARALKGRGHEGDGTRAESLLDQALSAAGELEMPKLREEILAGTS